jgi:hypothetical protein
MVEGIHWDVQRVLRMLRKNSMNDSLINVTHLNLQAGE